MDSSEIYLEILKALETRRKDLNTIILNNLGTLRPIHIVEPATCKLMGLDEAISIVKTLQHKKSS